MVAADVVVADETDAVIELDESMIELLLSSGLLTVALLGWPELSPAGAPPQADINIGTAIKNTK